MVFLIGVLYALVSGLTTVFVVPLMIQADSGVLAAWRRLWGSIKTAWKQYLAYVVIAFLLTVAAGIIASIVVGIVAIVLLIPILIVAAITHVTVSLSSTVGIAVLVALALLFGLSMLVIWTLAQVPVVTYLRYYALLVLGDIEETFHIPSDRQLSRRGHERRIVDVGFCRPWRSRAIRARVDRRRRACDLFRADPSGDTRAGGLSYPTLMLVAAANSTIFLVIFVTLGTDRSPDGTALTCLRVGVRRYPGLGRVSTITSLAVGLGAVLFVLVTVLDVVFARLQDSSQSNPSGEAAALQDLLASIPMRLLYGGITEEILLRWGVMAPIAFVCWGFENRIRERTKTPPAAVMWVAIVASAVAFGVGHLPALASTFDLTIALIIRTVLLNAIVGVALGWLFWQRSLETAMVAHAAFHIVLVTVSTAGTLFF